MNRKKPVAETTDFFPITWSLTEHGSSHLHVQDEISINQNH